MTAEHGGPPGIGHEIHFQDKTESKFESDVGFDKERANDNNPFEPKKPHFKHRKLRLLSFKRRLRGKSSRPNWLTFSLTV